MTDIETRLLTLLSMLEWAASDTDQDGREVSCCPYCKGINPGDSGARNFIKDVHGHRPSCRLKEEMKALEP
jgi:hypothetical protein